MSLNLAAGATAAQACVAAIVNGATGGHNAIPQIRCGLASFRRFLRIVLVVDVRDVERPVAVNLNDRRNRREGVVMRLGRKVMVAAGLERVRVTLVELVALTQV